MSKDKDSGRDRERSDHSRDRDRDRDSRDRMDRAPTSSRRSGEGSSGSRSRDKDRASSSSRDEYSSSKRLRVEPESRVSSSNSKISSSATESRDKDKDVQASKGSGSSKVGQPPPSSSSSSSSPATKGEDPAAPTTAATKKDLYDNVLEWENKRAEQMRNDVILKTCNEYCKDLENTFQAVLELKNSGVEDEEVFERKLAEGLLKITSLRNLNRMLKLKLKAVKDRHFAARDEVDADHLVLQNLLYEATHLHNQVSIAKEYRGIDEEINLIPVPQFYGEAPESISKPEITKTDLHRQRIARLEYEFFQRQDLVETCKALEIEKKNTTDTIKDQQSKLDSVKPMLETVLESTKPVQDFFQLNISRRKERNRQAQYLPPQLYVIFVQSDALKDATGAGDGFLVNLRGNIDQAKDLVLTPDEEDKNESDSDKEQDQEVEVSERRRLLRKKSSIHCTPEENKRKLIQRHPLWVEWIFKSSNDDKLVIQFYYILKLDIVTVKSKIYPSNADILETEPISSTEDLLNNLFAGDTGLRSPNPVNDFQLQRIDASGINEFTNEIGRPYEWAQKIAGVEFSKEPFIMAPPLDASISFYKSAVSPKMSVSSANIVKVVSLIRRRIANHTKLWNQLKLLENKNIQLPPSARELFPVKSSTTFKSWEPISYFKYCSYDFTGSFVRKECVSANNLFFKAVLERGRAIVTALVSLSVDFPVLAPIFCVELEQDGDRRNARNDTAIRELEKEVNIYAVKEFANFADIIVTCQLQRLIQCVDIVLETDFILGDSAGPSEFSREKLFLRAAVGRNVRRPFKYCGSGGGYFTQRY